MTKTDKELILGVLSQMDTDSQYYIDTMFEQLGEDSITRIDDLLEKMLENKLVAPAHSKYTVMRTQKGIALTSYSYDKIFPPRKALAEEILEHLFPTYYNGAFVDITDLVLDHSPNITGTEIRNILVLLVDAKHIQDNNALYNRLANPTSLKSAISKGNVPFVNAKMTPEGYAHILAKNNMDNKNSTNYQNITVKMGNQGIANFGSHNISTINNTFNKDNVVEVLKEIKQILKDSKQQDKDIVELALTAIEKEDTLDLGAIGKVLELCANASTVLDFGHKIVIAGVKLALSTGLFAT
ncbi:hypothetical protein [Aurantibacillus circumpalustris]|uniref:hypothetical protein n=1 Tax=Aurantibacillus circumpalustris TaxID=3036359 RepID=UPI00295A7B17|nr:hypothetical protein [Aurantibacillus circumpalustris]